MQQKKTLKGLKTTSQHSTYKVSLICHKWQRQQFGTDFFNRN